MKKTFLSLIVTSLLAIGGANTYANLTFSTTMAFESEYVFRSVQYADASFQPSVELAYGDFYIGTWVNQPIVDPGAMFLNEVDFYGGYGFALGDTFSADVGLTYYWFPEEPATDGYSREVYFGLSADVALAPSVYFYYDFDLDTFTIEGSFGHSFALGEGSPASFDLGAYFGYVAPKGAPNDVYYGGSADISYAFTDNASFSFGVRASGLGDDLAGGGRDGNFWWGMSFSAGF